MATPIICRTYRRPIHQCNCYRCRPVGSTEPLASRLTEQSSNKNLSLR